MPVRAWSSATVMQRVDSETDSSNQVQEAAELRSCISRCTAPRTALFVATSVPEVSGRVFWWACQQLPWVQFTVVAPSSYRRLFPPAVRFISNEEIKANVWGFTRQLRQIRFDLALIILDGLPIFRRSKLWALLTNCRQFIFCDGAPRRLEGLREIGSQMLREVLRRPRQTTMRAEISSSSKAVAGTEPAMSQANQNASEISAPLSNPNCMLRGVCCICGAQVQFLNSVPENPREGLHCPVCGAASRDRFLIHVLSKCLGHDQPLADWPQDKSITMMETSGRRGHPPLLAEKFSYWNIEYDPERIRLGVDPQKYADIQQLTFADETFDCVLSADLFEHVRCDDPGFHEIFRVLKPAGWFLLQVPYGHNSETVVKVRPEGDHDIFLCPPEYHAENALVYRIYGRDLLQRLRDIGFTPGYLRIADSRFGFSPQDMIVCQKLPYIELQHWLGPRLSYCAWTRLEQKRLEAEIPDIKRRIDVMVHKPAFTVVVDTRQGDTGLKDTIQSIRRQLYPFRDVRVLSGAAAPSWAISWLGCFQRPPFSLLKDMSLSDIGGDFIVFMQSGQRLASNALYEFAAAINQRPDIDLIYGDEDSFTASGSRRDPFHKPGWSPDYLETFNYIGFPACFRTAIARGCFDNVHVYDFVLRFTERTTRVLHVPKILGHGVEKLSVDEAALANAVALDIKALSGRLSRTGRRGSVYEHELHKGCYGVRLDLKRSPLVSVVIPTAGKTVTVGERRIDLLENVIGQIRDRSTYNNIEIIVIDNGDLSPNQLRMLAEAECERITYSDPVFNIAEKLNLGVSIANGEFLLLLNDDIEILTPSWIERLLEHFEKPHVGVVGAKLLYPNDQIQHVGVVQPFGNPDHVRRRFPRDDAGYFFSTCGVRNYSAVTGACMMTPASIYREVGGYSGELAVSFNDVDFCMKVRRKGLWVVYAPSAELIHMESLSHVVSSNSEELAWYQQRWAAELASDQFYNERFLAVDPPTFVPCVNQRML